MKAKLLIIFSMLLISQVSHGQNEELKALPINTTKDTFTLNLDTWPEFPGGTKAVNKFLLDNLVYPVDAEVNAISGRVMIKFVIEKDGSVTNVGILKSVDSILDKEALRVVRKMPNWKPGTKGGIPVRTRNKVDVVFKLPPAAYLESISFDSSLVTPGEWPRPIVKAEGYSLAEFIKFKTWYPGIAISQSIQGQVTIGFTVERNGHLNNVHLIQGVNKQLDNEALHVVKKLKYWEVGKLNGQPVDVNYTIDILFLL